jgi:hypothetical protein
VCRAIPDPVGTTRAQALLGRAKEESGDIPGACAAYAVVVDRWRTGRTGDEARARARAIGCKR